MIISREMQILAGALVALCSYFIGNINSAVLISRIKGKDIRKCGSGNPGTMNMLRTYGKVLGVLTLVLDVCKGVIPSLLGWLFMGDGQFLRLGADRVGLIVGGFFAVLGHIFPVVFKFKGGKGAATMIGVCLTMQPLYTLAAFAIGVLFLFATTVGSITSFIMVSAPLVVEGLAAASEPNGLITLCFLLAMYTLCLFAHRKNLVKLFSGREGRVVLFKFQKRKSPDRSIIFDERQIAE